AIDGTAKQYSNLVRRSSFAGRRTGPERFQEDRMAASILASDVRTIIFACEAGMGSSLMSVNALKKKLKKAQIERVTVVHKPARDIPGEAQVVVHKGLAKVASSKAPNA